MYAEILCILILVVYLFIRKERTILLNEGVNYFYSNAFSFLYFENYVIISYFSKEILKISVRKDDKYETDIFLIKVKNGEIFLTSKIFFVKTKLILKESEYKLQLLEERSKRGVYS